MPRSAIATGMVDFVLPPNEMPAQLLAYVAHAFRGCALPSPRQATPQAEDGLKRSFSCSAPRPVTTFPIQAEHHHPPRRAAHGRPPDRCGWKTISATCSSPRAKWTRSFANSLIGVTSFFRDSEIFEEAQKQVIPQLFAGKAAGAVIRVWVPGCSTGEEAYSIAMLLRERMEELKQNFKVQVFATDIDREAIDHARAGVYPSSIAADVSPERLARFFDQEQPDGSTYRIHKTIRDMLIFPSTT
jgi:two-component system, chemotaxis family, CheB/CheR fusion protein